MDNKKLDELLSHSDNRRFWLKPIGPPKDTPEWDTEELRTWEDGELEVHFHDNPVHVHVGDVLIGFRVRYSKLTYVAERLSVTDSAQWENRPEWARQRWPFPIKARNLTPEYGKVWKQYDLQPFHLAKEYNASHAEDQVKLGSVQRGNDKVQISRGFAEFLIQQIRALDCCVHLDDQREQEAVLRYSMNQAAKAAAENPY